MSEGLKTIEALRRGLQVLEALDTFSAASLHQLQEHTGIAKATLLRILKTLQQHGWVQRDVAAGRYLRTPAVDPSKAGNAWQDRITLAALDIRTALHHHLLWPTEIAVRQGKSMAIVDSHRPVMGLSINYRAVGFRPHLLASALGRSYFSHCDRAEQEEIVALLAASPREVDQVSRSAVAVARLLKQTLDSGYARRDPQHVGADASMTQKFGAIAVPIFSNHRVIASLGCAWLAGVTTEAQIVQAHLANLQDAAHAIGRRLTAQNVDRS